MQLQLELFEPLSIESANMLLQLLNDGRKRDLFKPISGIELGDIVLIAAQNKSIGVMFNIVDIDGKTPKGFSACWRNAVHVNRELAEYFDGKQPIENP